MMKRLLAALLFLVPNVAWATCSSVPYTFTPNTLAQSGQVNANFAAVVNCANTIDAGQIVTGVLPVARGGTNNPTWTAGSVVFATATTQLGQDNSNLFYDSTNKRLGIKTNTPTQTLEVNGGAQIDGAIVSTGASAALQVADRSTSGSSIMFRASGTTSLYDSVFGSTINFDNAGHVSIDTTPNASFALTVLGTVNATQYNINSRELAASGGTYNQLFDGSGNQALILGGSGDPENFYRNTSHTFQNIGGGLTMMSLTGSGDLLSYTLNAQNIATAGLSTACLVGSQYISGRAGLTFCTSDERLKDIGDPLADGTLALVDQLQPVNYVWKDNVEKHARADDAPHIGFVAQDVKKIMPQCVNTNPDGYYGLDSNCLIAHLAKAIQELDAKVSSK